MSSTATSKTKKCKTRSKWFFDWARLAWSGKVQHAMNGGDLSQIRSHTYLLILRRVT